MRPCLKKDKEKKARSFKVVISVRTIFEHLRTESLSEPHSIHLSPQALKARTAALLVLSHAVNPNFLLKLYFLATHTILYSCVWGRKSTYGFSLSIIKDFIYAHFTRIYGNPNCFLIRTQHTLNLDYITVKSCLTTTAICHLNFNLLVRNKFPKWSIFINSH